MSGAGAGTGPGQAAAGAGWMPSIGIGSTLTQVIIHSLLSIAADAGGNLIRTKHQHISSLSVELFSVEHFESCFTFLLCCE